MGSFDRILEILIKICTAFTFFMLVFLIVYMTVEGLPVFQTVSPVNFIFGTEWNPVGETGEFGILAMILGSFYVSSLAICMALPIGIGCAVCICFCIQEKGGRILLSFIDMLAGVPSVIFGFIGLMIVVRFFESTIGISSGECVLAGAVLLAVMILPFIITNCTESLTNGRTLYEGPSLNLGVSSWYTIRRIILPQSFRAVGVSLILAFSRAMGETMAVMMVMGNASVLPELLHKGETIPALIALEMGSAAYDSPHYHALYAAGLVLLVMLVLCNLLFYFFKNHFREWGRQ
ncbi:MAG: phosphate ABC transporter permease subunit PstC [Veillonellales bacterium]